MPAVKHTLKRLLLSYLSMVLAFTLIMIGVASIPQSAVEENVKASGTTFEQEGVYPGSPRMFMYDNYTDVLMLNGIYSEETGHPVWFGMMNYVWLDSSYRFLPGTLRKLTEPEEAKTLHSHNYGRYWHGYEMFLKPALCILDIQGIRLLNYALLFALLVWVIYLLYDRCGWAASLSLLACLLAMNFVMIPRSLQYSSMFYISFVSMIVVLLKPKLTGTLGNTGLTFFIIGGITVFIDYLTTPQLSLGLPLLAALLAYPKPRAYRYVVTASATWILGYASLWISKWIVGTCLTRQDFFAIALKHVEERASIDYDGVSWTLGTLASQCWSGLSEMGIAWLPVVIVLLIVSLLTYSLVAPQQRQRWEDLGWMWIVWLIVPVWYLVLRNHTIEHFFFTWRALLLPAWTFILWSIYLFITPKKKI